MLQIEDYLPGFYQEFPFVPRHLAPWEIVGRLREILTGDQPESGFAETSSGVWVHDRAIVEPGAVIKPPALIGDRCFVAATAYLRDGVALGAGVRIGPGVEVKASLVMSGAAFAHLNFVGDSLIGRNANLEAGAVLANHWNERADKTIAVMIDGHPVTTGASKFGALVGNDCRIGANAVLAPGTLLPPGTIIGRLQLVDQTASSS